MQQPLKFGARFWNGAQWLGIKIPEITFLPKTLLERFDSDQCPVLTAALFNWRRSAGLLPRSLRYRAHLVVETKLT